MLRNNCSSKEIDNLRSFFDFIVVMDLSFENIIDLIKRKFNFFFQYCQSVTYLKNFLRLNAIRGVFFGWLRSQSRAIMATLFVTFPVRKMTETSNPHRNSLSAACIFAVH